VPRLDLAGLCDLSSLFIEVEARYGVQDGIKMRNIICVLSRAYQACTTGIATLLRRCDYL